MTCNRVNWRLAALATLVMALLAAPAQATIVSFDFNLEFSEATPPSGTPPWLTATFDDGDTAGSVILTLSTAGLSGDEYVGAWYFNLDPQFNPGALNIAVSGESDIPGSAVNILLSANTFKADGDGFYDILLDFAQAPPSARFSAGKTAVFDITGIDELLATSFEFLSAPGPGETHGPFLSAAHVQGIGEGGEDSGWVAPGAPIPEPATMLLVGGGLLGLAGLKRRRG